MTRNCKHMRPAGLCEVDDCPNAASKRDAASRCFGGDGLPQDTLFAAWLFKENPELYRQLRETARQRGRLRTPVTVRALQDES